MSTKRCALRLAFRLRSQIMGATRFAHKFVNLIWGQCSNDHRKIWQDTENALKLIDLYGRYRKHTASLSKLLMMH